jgi:cytochrome b pre-mRNA-processing protein 3
MGGMFGFRRRENGQAVVDRLHHAIVAQSREAAFYERGGLPDSIEGRFESLALHTLLVLRRLRVLPPPAEDVAQDLVDRVFAHLEIALREMGVGDMGVPKRMKKIAGAFYDRTRLYDPLIVSSDARGLAAEIAGHLGIAAEPLLPLGAYCLASDRSLAACSLAELFEAPRFAPLTALETEVTA